ncbi:hypothetical protein [Pseudoxanthomonas sp. LARHCG66]
MKKLSANLLAGAVLISVLSACNPGNKQAGTDTVAAAPAAPVEAPEPTPAPVQGLAVPFAENALSMTVGGNCSLDAVNGSAVVEGKLQLKRGESVVIGGWAVDQAGVVPAQPQLVIHSDVAGYTAPLATGIERADVAAAMKNPALSKAGFESPLSLRDVPAGVYDLSVVVTGEAARRCPLNVLLTVTD